MSDIPDGLPEDLPLTTGSGLAQKLIELCRSTTLRLGEMLGALETAKLHLWHESVVDDWPTVEDGE